MAVCMLSAFCLHAICILSACYLHSVCILSACYLHSVCILSACYLHSNCILFASGLQGNRWVWRLVFGMSQITIRNLGQDVTEMLMLCAKANGRSLEAQIRVMLTTAVGLGPQAANRTLAESLSELQRAGQDAMKGLAKRADAAEAQNLALELRKCITRKRPKPRPQGTHPL